MSLATRCPVCTTAFRVRAEQLAARGGRVRMVVTELRGEKIDIVDFSEDLAQYVSHALSPAPVISATVLDETNRIVRVIVPDYKLSLAIGREGQNARLAARLTGAKHKVRPPDNLWNANDLDV